ncbi:MAG TPA: NADPH:quinone oxidoreductase family protein [Alphaproteobacteria bacterium]|nr:NADPH:quinone oxidoreductase family protein [Alphaproteobacteria bacterium]
MRAWRTIAVGEPRDVMQQTETELEPIGPGELRIRVAAAGLGFPDVLMCRGTYPLTPPLPFTSGQEFVGTVAEAGPGVTAPVGARLMGVSSFMAGRGSFAEECKTYEMMTFPAPATIPDADAASFTIAYHTGYIALARRAKLAEGETLLVHGGAGGTGFAAIQLGKALGAKVIATAGGADKAAFCRDLGADLVVDNSREDFVAAVNAETGGRGADVVFDPVGGELFERSVNCVALEGRLLPIGFACGRWGVVSPETLALKNIAMVGALGGGFDRAYMLSVHQKLMELYAKGAIRPVIDRRIGFSEIRDGVQALADRKVRGRAVAVY